MYKSLKQNVKASLKYIILSLNILTPHMPRQPTVYDAGLISPPEPNITFYLDTREPLSLAVWQDTKVRSLWTVYAAQWGKSLNRRVQEAPQKENLPGIL
jgi:hypothetical protein